MYNTVESWEILGFVPPKEMRNPIFFDLTALAIIAEVILKNNLLD